MTAAAAPPRRTPIVECDALYLERPGGEAGFALRGLTLSVEPGAFAPLLGPAGAGKTALLRVLAGRARPLAGRAVVAGVDLAAAGADEAREHAAEAVGYAPYPAGAGLLPELGLANAELPLRLAGRGRARARRRARELAEALGLASGAPAGRLTPADAARLAVAAALAHAPPLLLLDEPAAGLAPADRDGLIEALRRLGASEGTAILLATRDPALAHRIGGVVRVGGGRVRGELVRLVAFSRGEGERTEELAIVDGDGRVEIPPAGRAALGIGGRARVTLEDDHVGVWPERPPPETEPPWRRR